MEIINESNNRSYIYRDIEAGTVFRIPNTTKNTALMKTLILCDYENNITTYSISLENGRHYAIDPTARVIVVDAQLHVKG